MSSAKSALAPNSALSAAQTGLANTPIAPASVASGSGSGSGRTRQQGGRKKAAPPIEPDALYRAEAASVTAVVSAGTKRAAQDGGASEPRKRKRVDHSSAAFHAQGGASANANNANAKQQAAAAANSSGRQGPDGEGHPSLVEFSSLPTPSLYRYIIHHDLVPVIYPTPLTADDPPPPAALLDPARMASRAPTPAPLLASTTPANRPRRTRETKEASRRRSTRLLEEEQRGGLEQVPVLADVGELHGVLASIAQRHFKESSVREVDTLAMFLNAVKAKSGGWR
ncbi:hypothetical protein DFH11DRAFT_85339 [Phellopilus nigrolimitatus]|nr:hypothetical protein DFH11DRAFT_85339 [Phellopilus nigrolimitatus]